MPPKLCQRTVFNAPEPSQPSQPPKPAKQSREHKFRGKISSLWDYAADLDKDNKAPFGATENTKTVRVFRCKPCVEKGHKPKEYVEIGGATHFREHLQKKHNINVLTNREEAIEQHAEDAATIAVQGHWNANIRLGIKRQRASTASGINPVVLRGLFLNWIARTMLASV